MAYVRPPHQGPGPGRPRLGRGHPADRPRLPLREPWTAGRSPARPSVRLSERGDYELVIGAGGAATVAQKLARLAPGHYAASVQVEVGATAGERRRAALEVRTADGVTAANWTDTSTAVNYVAADRKSGTRFQRLFTPFTVPEGGGPVTLTLTAAAGRARIGFDNLRVVPAEPTTKKGTLAYEDFEHVPQGWGVFVKGDAGGSTDPRTHIAQRHAPFTQRGWNGKAVDDVLDGGQSLKSRGENNGLVYRTVPHTVRFDRGPPLPGHLPLRQREGRPVRLDHRRRRTRAPRTDPHPVCPSPAGPATHTYEFTAPADGEAWVGLRKVGDDGTAEFVLDTFEVREV